MAKDRPKTQPSLEFICIYELVKDLYCQSNGRLALDPTLMFKLVITRLSVWGRSGHQRIRDVQVDVAYRWFLNLELTDKIPDVSARIGPLFAAFQHPRLIACFSQNIGGSFCPAFAGNHIHKGFG